MKNEWGTIVLPFTFFTNDTKNYEFYTLTRVSDEKISLTKLASSTEVNPGTPLLVRMKNGETAFTLTSRYPTISGQIAEGSSADRLQLAGTYEGVELTANDYFISNNKFWRAGDFSSKVKAAPFRAYLKNTAAGAKASFLSIVIDDDSATAIDVLNVLNDADAEYYDVNGRRIPQLQRGMNIVKYGNGKTYKVNIK